MKKNLSYKVSSAIMCAAIAGTAVATPIISNVAAQQGDANTSGQDVAQSGVNKDISIYVNNSTAAITFDGTQKLDTFVKKALILTGIDVDGQNVRLDWVSSDGFRNVLRTGDATTDSESQVQTLTDFYELVKGQKRDVTLIVFTNQQELSRIIMSVNDDGSVAIDTVTYAPSVPFLVRYDANGGTLNGSSFVMRADGEQLSYIETEAEYDRHTFDGWYDAKDGGNKVDESTVITSDMRLYAHWIADTYTVDFDSQGGNDIDSKVVSVDNALYSLPTPEKEGCTFTGWYTEADGGERVISVKDANDVTLYAHWKSITETKGTVNDVTPFEADDADKTDKSDLDNTNAGTNTGTGTDVSDSDTNNPDDSDSTKQVDDTSDNTSDTDTKDDISTDDAGVNDKDDISADDNDVDKDNQTSDDTDIKSDISSDSQGSSVSDNGSDNSSTDSRSNTVSDSNNTTSASTSTEEVKTYKLIMKLPIGTSVNVSVKSTVKMSALMEKLGYSVASYRVKTNSGSEKTLTGDTTMKTIAEMADASDFSMIAYDKSGNVMGYATITKNSNGEYEVSLSENAPSDMQATSSTKTDKTTGKGSRDSSLQSASIDDANSDVDGKGKGEGETTIPSIKTADSSIVSVYGVMGVAMTALFGVVAFVKRRIRKLL